MTNKTPDYASSVRNCENIQRTHCAVKKVKTYKRIDPELKWKIVKKVFQKHFRETTLIFLHRYMFLRIMRDDCFGWEYGRLRQGEHGSIILNNEEWWSRFFPNFSDTVYSQIWNEAKCDMRSEKSRQKHFSKEILFTWTLLICIFIFQRISNMLLCKTK